MSPLARVIVRDHPEDERATFSGACPLCGKWIKKNVSRVSPLPVPLCFSVYHLGHDGAGWYPLVNTELPRDPMRPRANAHAACARKHGRKTEGQDQSVIAQQRRQALVDKRDWAREARAAREAGA